VTVERYNQVALSNPSQRQVQARVATESAESAEYRGKFFEITVAESARSPSKIVPWIPRHRG
jgi:hypothetical protein